MIKIFDGSLLVGTVTAYDLVARQLDNVGGPVGARGFMLSDSLEIGTGPTVQALRRS